MSVRNILQKDKAQFFKLFKDYIEFYKSTITDEALESTWGRIFDEQEKVYAAVATSESNSDEIIGFVTWVYHRHTWQIPNVIYLHDLYVDPSVRCKGTGRALINHVYDDAQTNGVKTVYWHTQQFNHRAQLLYTKVATKDDFVKYVKKF